ncbi:MAG TPA: hypothetical protein VMW10_04595, partial [Alphaproteobacteria bacterium]|nr:hypothetical protein [Alphaproteobacteria bacterium]
MYFIFPNSIMKINVFGKILMVLAILSLSMTKLEAMEGQPPNSAHKRIRLLDLFSEVPKSDPRINANKDDQLEETYSSADIEEQRKLLERYSQAPSFNQHYGANPYEQLVNEYSSEGIKQQELLLCQFNEAQIAKQAAKHAKYAEELAHTELLFSDFQRFGYGEHRNSHSSFVKFEVQRSKLVRPDPANPGQFWATLEKYPSIDIG